MSGNSPGPKLTALQFTGLGMNSALLRWVANGTIGTVLMCTLWLAGSLEPQAARPGVFQVAVAATPAAAASAPQR